MAFLNEFAKASVQSCEIDKELYLKYNVKRGLRNADFSGVLVGLTNIGDVVGYNKDDKGNIIPAHGELYYRGVELKDLCRGFQEDKRHGFEEAAYLLLSGKLPDKSQLRTFSNQLARERELPDFFSKNMILSLRGRCVMNMLARSVLGLYTADDEAENYSPENLLKQSMSLIAKFPVIVAYAYFGMRHSYQQKSLIIRHPQPELSAAENFLYMLKGKKYTKLEADLLDLSLVLHAEHGGGNNSSFTTRVVSSAQTDTYSAIAAALGSLKGGLHGGANLKVINMMDNIKQNVKNWEDEKEVAAYLEKILNKKAYDGTGKIYGIGHAIYTLSDPRAILLKEKAEELAIEKNRLKEFNLYAMIERLAPEVFYNFKGSGSKTVCANVDFYSGFVYQCLEIPEEIYTPIFAVARIAGWCAHRIEEVTCSSRRIIRPAYKAVYPRLKYTYMKDR
ncbi:citrate synthase [Marinilabilia salmonicolor]|jgi:citrate synthase|uniref:Citrate synthase n=1 Tax=Marinilabilia salmonicolor TaxID=989 RepID=A0A2T0XSZ9_9BACT|nr:citrate synthase [Marinilabilia salmonicolor]PRZ02080.1 citrate synthase [Marinilabilia salmonicolor]RCW39514.1 citrate synthase [Marinilabilia salmonicolor]